MLLKPLLSGLGKCIALHFKVLYSQGLAKLNEKTSFPAFFQQLRLFGEVVSELFSLFKFTGSQMISLSYFIAAKQQLFFLEVLYII